jgi:hypothetical protein
MPAQQTLIAEYQDQHGSGEETSDVSPKCHPTLRTERSQPPDHLE